MTRTLVNLGCGPHAQPTCWLDCDGSWNVLATQLPLGLGRVLRRALGHAVRFPGHVRYVNLLKRLPFADGSVDAVYFSHVLEHLHLDEGRRLLAECRRILKPGGVIRVVVPDTEHYLAEYRRQCEQGEPAACPEFNRRLGFRSSEGAPGLLQRAYGALTDFHSHKFMYDRPFLADCLGRAGFVSVREVGLGDSAIPEVGEIESGARLGHGQGFGCEALKPH